MLKDPFFSSYFLCFISIISAVTYIKATEKSYPKSVLIDDLKIIGVVFGSSFGYGLYQSIDKLISYENAFVFYFFFLLSVTIVYFQNTFLLNDNHRFFSKSLAVKVAAMIFVFCLLIPSDVLKITGCYVILFLNAKINAILERKNLFNKSLVWLIAGIILMYLDRFEANFKLIVSFSVLVIYNAIHSYLSLENKWSPFKHIHRW